MNWGYEVEELASAYSEKQRLRIEANKLKIKLRQCSEDLSKNQNVSANDRILNEIKRDEKTSADLGQ